MPDTKVNVVIGELPGNCSFGEVYPVFCPVCGTCYPSDYYLDIDDEGLLHCTECQEVTSPVIR